MSELQSQVQTLRKGIIAAGGLSQVPSLFLTSLEAAKIDISAVYEAAVKSLRILVSYDERLSVYATANHILHSSSVSLQRELKTREENDVLDKQLEGLLQLLMLYVNIQDTHHIIEYLIRRYRAHELNSVALISCFLHSHDSKVFARIVQLSDIKDSVWSFLSGVKQSGIPLARVTLVQQSVKDSSLLKIVCDNNRRAQRLIANDKRPSQLSLQGAEEVLSFATAVLIERIQLSVDEASLRVIAPYVLEGFASAPSSKSNSFCKASCMIIAQLSRSTGLSRQFLTPVFKALVTLLSSDDKDTDDIAMTICIVLAHQDYVVDIDTTNQLFLASSFERSLTRLSHKADLSVSLQSLARSLTSALRKNALNAESSSKIVDNARVLLGYAFVNDSVVRSVLADLLNPALEVLPTPTLAPLLRFISQRHPELVGSAISSAKHTPSQALDEALTAAFVAVPTMHGVSSLLLALRDSMETVRIAAMEKFVENVSPEAAPTADVVALCEAVCEGLVDESSSVAVAAWTTQTVGRVARFVSAERLLAAFISAWGQWYGRILDSKRSIGILKAIIDCIGEMPVISSLWSTEPGRVWALSTLCFTAQGCTARGLECLSSKKRDRLNALAASAVETSKSTREVVSLFAPITSKLMKAEESANILPRCFAKASEQDMSSFVAHLKLLSAAAVDDISVESVAMVLDCVLTAVSNPEAKAAVLTHQIPLLERLIAVWSREDADIIVSLVSDAIRSLPEDDAKPIPSTLEAFTVDFFAADSLSTAASRLLVSLLQSQNATVVPLISLALETCFLSRPEAILLRIAYATDDTVPITARTAALCALSSFVANINETSSVSSFITLQLRPELAYSVLMCLPLVFYGCDSAYKSFRSAALEIAQAFVSLNKKLNIQHAVGGVSSSISLGDIGSFMSVLWQNNYPQSVGINDASPFARPSGLPTSLLMAFKSIILGLVRVLGWKSAAVSASLIKTLTTHVSLSEVWDTFAGLFDSKEFLHPSSPLLIQIFDCLRSVEDIDKETLKKVVTYLLGTVENGDIQRDELLSIYNERLSKFVSSSERSSVFSSLLRVHVSSPGQTRIVAALCLVPIQSSTLASSVTEYCSSFQKEIEQVSHDDAMTDGEDESEGGSSVAVQCLCSVLEIILGQLRSFLSEMDVSSLSSILTWMFDTLRVINDKNFNSVLIAEYCKTLIFEIASICLSRGGEVMVMIKSTPKKSTGKQKKNAQPSDSSTDAGAYTSERIVADVGQIFAALQFSRTSGLQLAAISALDTLLSLKIDLVALCIDDLGLLLRQTVSDGTFLKDGSSEREGLVHDIMLRLTALLKKNGPEFIPQHVLHPLCFHFGFLSSHRRSYLLRSAVEMLGDTAIAPTVSVLLTHCLTSYDDQAESVSSESLSDGFILLSRAAQRKSKRVLQSSRAEDIFKLSLDFPLRRSGFAQVSSLVALTKVAHAIFQRLRDDETAGMDGLIDIDLLEDYTAKVLQSLQSNSKFNSTGIRATMLLLHLEYIFDTMENPVFHRVLVTLSEKGQDVKLQSHLIEIAEQVLELVAELSKPLHESQATENRQLLLLLGGVEVSVDFTSLCKWAYEWSLNIIKSLQRLLDGPTFITILQELLDHEHLAVRQKAIQMLSDRLAELKIGKAVSEQALYIDLCTRVRAVLRGSINDRGLVQSAVVCIDVMAKALGRGVEWTETLTETLADVVATANELSACIQKGKLKYEEHMEVIKLQGSVFLCAGTLCGVVGVRCLSALSPLMSLMIASLQNEGSKVIEKGTSLNELQSKTVVLLLRSVIASITSIVAEMPSFFHPYLHNTLTTVLNLYDRSGFTDADLLSKDIDRCISVISSKLPMRLSIPSVLSNLPSFLEQRTQSVKRFVEYLGSMWTSIDRAFLTANLHDLSSIILVTMDYRGVHEGDDEMNDVIIAMTVELCLKLTESELKNFLIKVADWRDELNETPSKKSFARGTTYFQFIAALCHKLKTIFVPLMAYVWPSATSALEEFATFKVSGKSSSKKRKANEDVITLENRAEAISKTQWVLTCIRSACIHDTEGFVDEDRFVAVNPVIGELLTTISVFENGEEYLNFVEANVIPCLSSMAAAVGKDVLWKPLNHKVLMMTREKKKHERMAAVKTLYSLFNEVGEEYLLLLPECMPFLSELLEEENQDVLNLAVELVKFIEGISGESLDQYLQ